MTCRTVHIHTKQQALLPWGHQEVPARFNFASDVMDYWVAMEKVMGEETQRWTIGLSLLMHPCIQYIVNTYVSGTMMSYDAHLP